MPVPRIINLVLGLWLFISAFVWPHATPQFLAVTICGLLIAAVALMGATFPGARYLNTVIAACLFAFTMSRAAAWERTRVHDAIIAIVVFLVALAPGFSREDRSTMARV